MFVRHSTTLRTGILLVGIPIVFQLGALAYLLRVQQQTAVAEQWELHSKEVLSLAGELSYTLSLGHSAMRGTAIFQDPGFEAERWRDMSARWPVLLARLRKTVADNATRQSQLDRVKRAGDDYMEWFQGMRDLALTRQWDAFRGVLLAGHGKDRLDRVESALAGFVMEEERLDRTRLGEAARSRRRERQVMFALGAAAIGLAIAMLIAFTRALSSRLSRVSLNSQRLATGEPLLDPLPGRDEVAALDAVLHDTAAKLAQAAEAERRYAAELEERRQVLEQTNKDLTFRTQENEMFVYSVSHDLRSPLVNAQGFTKELTRACDALRGQIATLSVEPAQRAALDGILDDDIAESISFIQSAVTRLSGIVDALLRLSRAGRVVFSQQPVDLTTIADRIVRSMRATIDDRGARVTLDPLPAVVGDPVAIEQVLANLVGNAVNYLEPTRPGRIHIGTLQSSRAADDRDPVTIYVRDNGMGIPAQYLGKLFVPFERLHGNIVKGEGIGLAVAKRIVERLGGRIWAESSEGQGSTFFVSLARPAR